LVPRELSRLVASCPRGQTAASWNASWEKKFAADQISCAAERLQCDFEHHGRGSHRYPTGAGQVVRISVSILGIVCCVIMTLTFQEKSLGLLFGLAFSLAWWSEVARRLPVLMALGAAVILAGAAFRLGWEAALFSLVFVAMWHFAADKRL
jgi:hypothetical protein